MSDHSACCLELIMLKEEEGRRPVASYGAE